MKRFSQILLYVTIVLLLVWQLPWCYNFFTSKPEKTPFTLYSFVIDDFAMMGQEGVIFRVIPIRRHSLTVFCPCFMFVS